jgi:hypothetical protein
MTTKVATTGFLVTRSRSPATAAAGTPNANAKTAKNLPVRGTAVAFLTSGPA